MFKPQAILHRLLEHDAAFVIVGGMAAVARGASVVTTDLDLCYDPTPEQRARLIHALADLRPYPRGVTPGLPFVWDERTLRDVPLLTLTTDAGPLDLLPDVPGVGQFADVLAASDRLDVSGLTAPVLNLDALIEAKRALRRPKDLLTLPILEALRAMGGG